MCATFDWMEKKTHINIGKHSSQCFSNVFNHRENLLHKYANVIGKNDASYSIKLFSMQQQKVYGFQYATVANDLHKHTHTCHNRKNRLIALNNIKSRIRSVFLCVCVVSRCLTLLRLFSLHIMPQSLM